VKGSLQDVDFSPDGRLVAAGALTGDIAIWSVPRRSLERTIHHNEAILTLRFSPDGKEIATGDLPGNVDFWNPASGPNTRRTERLRAQRVLQPGRDRAPHDEHRLEASALGPRIRKGFRRPTQWLQPSTRMSASRRSRLKG
jgi:WD40 repeat protein